MGTKYSSVTINGYNASPPPDNGTTSASNQLTWSKHKTKIGDPLNNALTAMNAALVTALDQSVRSVTASDSTVAGDNNKTIQIASTVTASITISLGDATTMAAGYIVTIANQSAVACVIDRVTASNTINGVTATIPIPSLESITLIVNSALNGYIVKSRGFNSTLTLSGALTYGGVTLTNAVTGTGKMVLDNAPTMTSPTLLTSLVTTSTTFTAFAGATTLLTIGGTGATSVVAIPGTLDASGTTAAFTVDGGAYIVKALNVGGIGTFSGGLSVPVNGTTAVTFGSSTLTAAAETNVQLRTGTGKYAWLIGAQHNIDGLEIIPSTAAGGTTFTTAAISILPTGAVTIPGTLGVSGVVTKTLANGTDYAAATFARADVLLVNTTVGDLNYSSIQFSNGASAGVNLLAVQAGADYNDFVIQTYNGVSREAFRATSLGNITIGGTLGVTGAITGSALLDLSGASAGQIKFPATQNASADANTLDDYEEGTFNPTDGSGASLSITNNETKYVKIGNQVLVQSYITYPSTANGSNASLASFPFSGSAGSYGVAVITDVTGGLTLYGRLNGTTMTIFNGVGTAVTNAALSTKALGISVVYTL